MSFARKYASTLLLLLIVPHLTSIPEIFCNAITRCMDAIKITKKAYRLKESFQNLPVAHRSRAVTVPKPKQNVTRSSRAVAVPQEILNARYVLLEERLKAFKGSADHKKA